MHERIWRLRELVLRGLHKENCDLAFLECNSLAQDTQHVLLFFTLKSIFRELADALEGEPTEVHRFERLVQGIAERVSSILQKLGSGEPITYDELEGLVRTHVVNRSLFRH
jgi:hypothetical protein